MNIYKPPYELPKDERLSIFLAGSIDMGNATNWQEMIQNKLQMFDINVFNPRRDDWDNLQEQSANNEYFKKQVNWELDALDKSTWILMYLEPGSLAPISLLELGLYSDTSKLHVVCPDGFYRKGNVQIVCERYGIKLYNDLDSFMNLLITALTMFEK
jgi:hypothetical protein